ncbi:TPA: ead/Ea22-like family protein [Citrobacter braakii]|nr:ead/Ea22-like family protein [Citrobacter braakii]
MKAFNKQTLREAATEATQGEWYVDYDFDVCHESGAFIAEAHGDNLVQNAKFIAAANPATVLALLDELEATKHTAAVDHEAACSLVEENEELKRRIAELEARTVCLPKLPVLGSTAEWYEGFAAGASGMRNECADAIHAAGIGVKGE